MEIGKFNVFYRQLIQFNIRYFSIGVILKIVFQVKAAECFNPQEYIRNCFLTHFKYY